MTAIASPRIKEFRCPGSAWLLLTVMPLAVGMLTAALPAWVRMWALAISVFGSLKWLTFAA
jgi:hypothetical protein